MGYWTKNGQEVVIRAVLGPGPNAKHSRTYFVPDQEWQEEQIAQVYKESGRYVTYLGDWHSHPSGLPRLSIKDRITLWRIANYKQARIPNPIMGVLAVNEWNFKLWHQESTTLFDVFVFPFVRELNIYEFSD